MKVDVPEDWRAALAEVWTQPWFESLGRFVDAERAAHPDAVFPGEEDVFAALRHTPLSRVRVVILGQDPYPTRGHAHGLAFSVRPEVSPLPASLRNIFKERESDLGLPPPRSGSLLPWADRGVLLLNTALTVRESAANSHKGRGWEDLTDAMIDAVSRSAPPSVFLLWGRPAQAKAGLISGRHVVLSSPHPSPLSAYTGFFGSRPFTKTNAALASLGREGVDWSLDGDGAG